METQICSICGIEKDLSEFYIRKSSGKPRKDCKKCRNLSSKKYREANKDRLREVNKNWRKNNKEKSDAIYARYRATEKRRAVSRNWARKNREKSYAYRNNKYHTDPQYNLNIKVRRRIWAALNLSKIKKPDRTIKILGCSYNELKTYIESRFTDGMTWDKVISSEIHLDHIIPVSHFDLTNTEELLKCFHYTNLQPLWAEENLSKSNKIED